MKGCFALAVMAITALTLDVVCMITGVFPPSYRQGNESLGYFKWEKHWINNRYCGKESRYKQSSIPELEDDPVIGRHRVGFRSSRSVADFIDRPLAGPRIICLGDSHTDLLYAFPYTHMGVLEKKLRDNDCEFTEVLGAGHSRYSPLQYWKLYETKLAQMSPDIVIMNFYLGNDFYDLLRPDDRPHLVPDPETQYSVALPRYIKYADPNYHGLLSQSRLVYLWKKTAGAKLSQIQYAMDACGAFGISKLQSLRYVNDLRRSVDDRLWYNGAVAAQFVNQALFFNRFPGSLEECVRRAEFVLQEMIADNPNTKLVLCPIPSRALVQPDIADPIYESILTRLPLDRETVLQQEQKLYNSLKTSSLNSGWLFVETIKPLREAQGELYFRSDLHLAPEGSRIIGEAQAQALFDAGYIQRDHLP